MEKKNKIRLIGIIVACVLVVAVGLTLVLIFTNKPKSQTQLDEPSIPQVQVENGKTYLVTNLVENATEYRFVISNANWTDDIVVVGKEPKSDVSNIFEPMQTYRFFAIAIGTGDFSNSPQSESNQYTTKLSLDSPTIVFASNQNLISWQAVKNAENYSIYMSIDDGQYRWVGNTQTTNFEIANIVQSYQQDQTTIYSTLNFYVIATAPNSNYGASQQSNALTKNLSYQFDAPQNLQIISNQNWKLENGTLFKTSDAQDGVAMSWDYVLHCTEYVLNFDDEQITLSQEQFSVVGDKCTYSLPESLLQNDDGTAKYGDHTMQIKCATHGNINQSEYSLHVEFSYKQKFQFADDLNIVCYVGENSVWLKWNAVLDAKSYLVKIGSNTFSQSVTNNLIQLSFSQFGSLAGYTPTSKSDFHNHFVQDEKLNVSICIQVEAYGNYIASGWTSSSSVVAVKDSSELTQ